MSFCSLDLFRKRLLNPEQFKKSNKEFEGPIKLYINLLKEL